MKKIIVTGFIVVLVAVFVCGCTVKDKGIGGHEEPTAKTDIIIPSGTTLQTRIAEPEGYKREKDEEGSFSWFLRNYEMKEHGAPVLLYDGTEKANQDAHAAVFRLPLEAEDLQQCADSVMRVYAEYYFQSGQYQKIVFKFTNGFLCSYPKWIEGYRVDFSGGTSWKKTASYDLSYESFLKYLRIVFSYAGTASMESLESETIPLEEMGIGDVILKGGSPGHVVMVVDMCINDKGEKAYLLAQGYMPAQEFHVIKNPLHSQDPWYYEDEMQFPLSTAEYTFQDETMIRSLVY